MREKPALKRPRSAEHRSASSRIVILSERSESKDLLQHKNSSRILTRELFSVYASSVVTDQAEESYQPCQILLRLMSLSVAVPHMVMVDLSSPTILSI